VALRRRSAGLRLRLLLTVLGAAMLVGGVLAATLLAISGNAIAVSARPDHAARVVGAVAGGMAALVALVVWLLDRLLVAPLSRVDEALDRVSGATASGPLLAEGGDLIGRVAPAINRLEQRLGDEHARVRAQIDELRKANDELRTAREHAARSERLASVGRLAAGVAHEVGNPMTALIGFLSILRDRLAKGRGAGDYLDRMEREANRVDRILRDLLALARAPDRLAPVDLQRSALHASSLVRAQPNWPGAAVRISVPQTLPSAAGDEHYVVQVFVNLLVNAAKAGAGEIRVTAKETPEGIAAEVSDDGRGLLPEQMERLFEPFFTTSAPGEGTGLGLALCHATMERFGGSIVARSGEGGRGASFFLHFRRWTEVARSDARP
jgi:signal transduction histidine kinase